MVRKFNKEPIQYDIFESIDKQETLDNINNHIRACKRCKLHITRRHALKGEGNIDARIMFIALSPGVKEDLQNRMFIGPSGQVFNRLLQASGIDRKSVFMTNLVKCLLPKNRKPKMEEIEACSLFLTEEISTINPEFIVPLGAHATNAILRKYNIDSHSEGMSFTNINGRLISFGDQKVYPLPHPAALLYNPSFEPNTIEKYKQLKSLI